MAPGTVVRGGFGMFYGGQGALGANGRPVNNFPFNRSATLQSSGTKPAVQLSAGVPTGLLVNGTSLRLVCAPRGESSGHVTFPVR